jgi:hypothetical protein
MNKEKKIERRGGIREGAGQPLLYGEKTINITFRIPKSRKQEVKENMYAFLKQFKTQNNDC